MRLYDTASEALRDMMLEPPSIVFSEWRMNPMSGYRLLKVLRHASMQPLCFVPVIIVTGHATRSAVESAYRAGAHAVLVKPLSASTMRQRVEYVVQDARHYERSGDGYVIHGVADSLDTRRSRDTLPVLLDEIEKRDIEIAARSRQAIVDQIVAEQADAEMAERTGAPAAASVAPQRRYVPPRRPTGGPRQQAAADASRSRWSQLWGN